MKKSESRFRILSKNKSPWFNRGFFLVAFVFDCWRFCRFCKGQAGRFLAIFRERVVLRKPVLAESLLNSPPSPNPVQPLPRAQPVRFAARSGPPKRSALRGAAAALLPQQGCACAKAEAGRLVCGFCRGSRRLTGGQTDFFNSCGTRQVLPPCNSKSVFLPHFRRFAPFAPRRTGSAPRRGRSPL